MILGSILVLLGGCQNQGDIKEEVPKVEEHVVLEEIENEALTLEEAENKQEEILFYHQALSDDLISTLESISPINESVITYNDLRHVIVSHYDFEGEVQRGELIVNAKVADEIVEIFKEVFEAKYPIEKMVLVSEYNNDDDLSMADNNTSAFNFREITGGESY